MEQDGTMSDFDPIDDELKRALHQRAGISFTGAAHADVLARSNQIRRRRLAIAGGGAMSAILVAGLILLPTGTGNAPAPASDGTQLPGIGSTSSTTTPPSLTDAGIELDRDTSTTTQSTPAQGSGSAASTAPSDTATQSSTSTSTSAQPGPTSSTTAQSTPTTSNVPASRSSVPTSVETSTTAASQNTPAFTKTYGTPGGSLNLTWNGSSLTINSINPVPGYQADIKDDDPDRVRVDFDNGSADYRVEVRAENGTVSEEIS
jgi:hypothetical protein